MADNLDDWMNCERYKQLQMRITNHFLRNEHQGKLPIAGQKTPWKMRLLGHFSKSLLVKSNPKPQEDSVSIGYFPYKLEGVWVIRKPMKTYFNPISPCYFKWHFSSQFTNQNQVQFDISPRNSMGLWWTKSQWNLPWNPFFPFYF